MSSLMQIHNPRIMRTLLVNIAKNMVHLIPGAKQVRRLILGSPFGPTASNIGDSWHERREMQIKQILIAYLKEWADVDWFQNKVVVELGSGDDISIPFCFALLGASRAYATDVPLIQNLGLSDTLRDRVTSLVAGLFPQRSMVPPKAAEGSITKKSHLCAEDLLLSLIHISEPTRPY